MFTFSIFGPTIYESNSDGRAGANRSLAGSSHFMSNILQYVSHFLDVISGEEDDEVVVRLDSGGGEQPPSTTTDRPTTQRPQRDADSTVFYFDDDSLFRNGVSISQLNQHTTLENMTNEEQAFDCTICQETVRTGIYRKINSCGHCFHVHCIDSWLDQHSSCPVCRQEIVPGNSSHRTLRNILYQLRSSTRLVPTPSP